MLSYRETVAERESNLEVVPSKLSSAVDIIHRVILDLYRTTILRSLCATKCETLRADFLSLTLAITGRQTPGDSASSVVDSSMYVTALPATGEPVTCTP